MFYGDIFKALNKAKVKYVVAGGVAVVLHGYSRFTKNLDLIVFLENKNLERFYEALKKTGYSPRVPVSKEQFVDHKQRERWKKEKGMIVFSFYEKEPPYQVVDMFVDEPFPFNKMYQARVDVVVDKIRIPLLSIGYLKKLKEAAGRPQDLMDIVQLNTIQKMRRDENKK